MAQRVVVDLNILISFLIGKRLGGFITLLREAEFLLLVSPPLLAEFGASIFVSVPSLPRRYISSL